MFDPTMEIEEGSTPSFVEQAEQQINDADVVTSDKKVSESLKKTNFAKLNISDLSEFQIPSIAPVEGEYQFTVEQGHLKEAILSTKMTSITKNTPNPARLTLSKDKLRVSTFNPSSFSEYIIPLLKPAENVQDGESIRFIFDHNILTKIANTFTEDVIVMRVFPKQQLCKVIAGKTNLEISIYPDSEFADFQGRLQSSVLKNKIYPETIRKAIQFIYPFSMRDDLKPNFSMIEIRDGMAVGGTTIALATVTSQFFKDTNLKIRYELLMGLEKVLQFFDSDNTYLFESETHYIIRDENVMCGFEKTPYTFLDINGILQAPRSTKTLLIPRDILQNTLQKLSVVSVDRKLPVTISYRGLNNDATMTLMTQDSTGKQSKDTISIAVKDSSTEPNTDEHTFKVTLNALLKAISNHDVPNIELFEIEGQAVLLEDIYEDNRYLTILSIFND